MRRIQEEIRSIRISFAALVGVFASSTALRTEIPLSELRLISNNILERQRQSHATTSQILTRQSVVATSHERIQPMLQELLRTQEAYQPFPAQRVSSSLSDGASASAWSNADERLSLGFGVTTLAGFVKQNGHRCRCLCHTNYAWKSPDRLKQLLGLLFLGYSGTPATKATCERCACHRNQDMTMAIRYIFPTWFVARVLSSDIEI